MDSDVLILCTLIEVEPILLDDGILMIENVREESVFFWRLESGLLDFSWSIETVKPKKSYMM